MDKDKADAAMENLRKMAEGFGGLLGIIGEEISNIVNKVISEAKEHHHKEKEHDKEEKPPQDKAES